MSSKQQMFIFFNKMWHFPHGSRLPPRWLHIQCTTQSETWLLLLSAALQVGLWAVLPHVCFIASSSGLIYSSYTGHSSEWFISEEDKRKIMALLLRHSGSVCTTDRFHLLQSCNRPVSHQHNPICLFRGNKLSPMCASLHCAKMLCKNRNSICWSLNSIWFVLMLTELTQYNKAASFTWILVKVFFHLLTDKHVSTNWSTVSVCKVIQMSAKEPMSLDTEMAP